MPRDKFAVCKRERLNLFPCRRRRKKNGMGKGTRKMDILRIYNIYNEWMNYFL